MKVCIIVDGISAGRLLAVELQKRGVRCLHVQSNPELKSLGEHIKTDYVASVIYQGDIKALEQAILNLVSQEDILAVIAGSEPSVLLADQLSERLTPELSNGTGLSSARRDKFAMRNALREAKLAVPEYICSKDLEAIQKWAETIKTRPVVLKPIDSAGTDGVFFCHNEKEIAVAYKKIMGVVNILGQTNTQLLAESFLVGTEYVVNSVSCRGQHKLVDVWVYRKRLVGGRHLYDREQLVNFQDKVVGVLSDYVNRVLDAVGIQFGPSHAEVMLTGSGPVLVEVGARLGGATNVEASQECIGQDSVNLTIDSYIDPKAFGDALERKNHTTKSAMVVDFATTQEGIVERENFSGALSDLPSLKTMLIKIKSGDSLVPTRDLLTSPAKFHLVHKDEQQIAIDYQRIQEVGARGFVVRSRLQGGSTLQGEVVGSAYKRGDEQQEKKGLPPGVN